RHLQCGRHDAAEAGRGAGQHLCGAAAPGPGRDHRAPAPDQRPDDLDRRHRRGHAQPDRR
ncbi:hypothetical protein, partial [Stenotrophomonas maltophilia group sp. Smal32]|uniref:hypothetical protein n=1 Tax=Stenotrophomonas maltophilia group sp. Smal32 TaxID=3377164 RepID=UPI00384F6038